MKSPFADAAPDRDRLMAKVADRGMAPGLITNAYLLSTEAIMDF